jgi:hypothetical protein
VLETDGEADSGLLERHATLLIEAGEELLKRYEAERKVPV